MYFLKYWQKMGDRNLSAFTWPMISLAAGTRNLFISLYEVHVRSAYSRFEPWHYVLFSFSFCTAKKIEIKSLAFKFKESAPKGPARFSVRLIRHWKRLLKEKVESQSLETESKVDSVLSKLLWAPRRLDESNTRGVVQLQWFCVSVLF